MIDPRIQDRVATCGGNPHALTTPTMKGVITDVARSSAHVLRIPGHVIRTVRYGTIPRDGEILVRSPQDNRPVLIGGTTVSPACGIMGSLEILNKHESTGSLEIGDAQNVDYSIDGKLAKDRDYTTISAR